MKNKKYKIVITWSMPYELNGLPHYNITEIIVDEEMVFGIITQILSPEIMKIEVLNNDK